jgi:hypothetical protein
MTLMERGRGTLAALFLAHASRGAWLIPICCGPTAGQLCHACCRGLIIGFPLQHATDWAEHAACEQIENMLMKLLRVLCGFPAIAGGKIPIIA